MRRIRVYPLRRVWPPWPTLRAPYRLGTVVLTLTPPGKRTLRGPRGLIRMRLPWTATNKEGSRVVFFAREPRAGRLAIARPPRWHSPKHWDAFSVCGDFWHARFAEVPSSDWLVRRRMMTRERWLVRVEDEE